MKVTVMPIIVGGLGTILKKPEKRPGELYIRARLETVQTTTLLRTVQES